MRKMVAAAIPVLLAVTAFGHAQVSPTGPAVQVAATLGQAIAGPVGDDVANTMVSVTNRDLRACLVGFVFLGSATTAGPAVFLNGINTPSLDLTLPSGGAGMVTMTASQLVQGLMSVFVVSPCSPSSISISGSYTLLGPDGQVNEVFTLRANGANQWLRHGRCLVVTTNQNPTGEGGPVENLGVATSSVSGLPAPSGTELELFLFNAAGQRIGDTNLAVTGEHTASFPIPVDTTGKVTAIFCLRSPSTSFDLDLTAIKLVQGPNNSFQFDNAIFADGFESGDLSAWSAQLP